MYPSFPCPYLGVLNSLSLSTGGGDRGQVFFLALVSILAVEKRVMGGHEVIRCMCALKWREEGARVDYRIFGDLAR